MKSVFIFYCRREISEESLDFFQKFSSIRERADRPRDAQRRKRAAVDSLIEACEALNVSQVYAEHPARSGSFSAFEKN